MTTRDARATARDMSRATARRARADASRLSLAMTLTLTLTATATREALAQSPRVDACAPSAGPMEGGTLVTIRGVDFPVDDAWTRDETLSHGVACRFALTGSVSATTRYSAGTTMNGSEVRCAAPSGEDTGTRRARASVSFDGYPADAERATMFFASATWIGSAVYEYYDAPVLYETTVSGGVNSLAYTGETSSGDAAAATIRGGPFANRETMRCRFGGVSVTEATYVNATMMTCPVCASGPSGCGGAGERMPWLLDASPASTTVELSLNGVDYHVGQSVAFHGAPSGVETTHERVDRTHAAYASTRDVGASTMTLDPMTARLVDDRGNVAPDARGFTIEATLDVARSADAGGVTMSTTPSSVVTTVDGEATFRLVFSAPLPMGEYVVVVAASDCTGATCVALERTSEFRFSVVPGAPAGLLAVPSDLSTIPADEEVDLARVTVYVVDAAGNRAHAFDESSHAVTVTSVDASDAPRATGSTLGGVTTASTSDGVATFDAMRLFNPPPAGARTPGPTAVNNLTRLAPSRGVGGVDDAYRLLFSASFGSTVTQFASIIGRPRYLEIDGHVSRSMTTSAATVTIPAEITVRLYDAGNNRIESYVPNAIVDVLAYGGEYALEPTSATSATDATGTGTWTFPANAIELESKPAAHYAVAFHVRGSAYIQPAIQLVELTPGSVGHAWKFTMETDVRFAGASTPLGDLTVYAADIGGSAVGAADRFDASTSAYTVDREFACSCATLTISGTLTGNTLGVGAATLSGLTIDSATLGEHAVTCRTTSNTLRDSGSNVVSTNTVALVDLEFTIRVTSGPPTAVTLTNTPETTYLSSFGAMNASTFRLYAADYYVPLDVFEFQMYDAFANAVDYVLSGDPAVIRVHFTSGVAGDVVGATSDYASYDFLTAERDAFIVPDPNVFSTGLNATFDPETNGATLRGIALKRPPVGTHTLTFEVPSMPTLPNVTRSVAVALGRAHHLAVSAPCAAYYPGGSCSSLSELANGSPCTCTQFKSSSFVRLNAIRVFVVDGGDNPMGANYSPTCRTGETSCPGEVEAIFDVERTDPCVYSGNACLTTQPTRHVKTLTNGAVTFSDVAFRLPKSTRQGGATTLTFRAPGLVDVTIAFDVWPGDASSLEVVVPSAFDGSLDGVGLKSSTYALVAGVSNPFLVYVRDDAGNRLHDEDTSTRTVTVAVVDDTAVLQGDLTATATDGACAFSNLFLGSPPRGEHVLRFSSPGLTDVTVGVKIVEGLPASLAHVATLETTTRYETSTTIALSKFVARVLDAGGSALESAAVPRDIHATLRSTFNSTRTFTNITYASAVATAPAGRAVAVFNGVTASALEAGAYALTFSSPGLISDVVAVTIVAADARRVYAPPSKSYLSVTHARPSTIPSARVVTIPSFVVVVADDGWNEIVTTDGRVVEVNVTRIGGDATPRDTATVTFPDQSFRFQHDGPDVGKALISGVEMRDAVAGTYAVTISSPPLDAYAFNITIGPGEISSLDACGCAHCVRRPPTYAHPRGVCVDERAYESDDSVSLEEVVVVARDAGGLLMGSSLNALEPDRVVTVALVNYTLDTGERVDATNVEDSPLIADATSASCVDAALGCAGGAAPRASSVGALYVVDGFVAWCADGTEQKLAKSFCAPADEVAFENKRERDVAYFQNAGGGAAASSASSNLLAGTTGLGEDYYGVRHEPGFIGNASGLRFTRPRAGRYLLRFSSCRGDACLAQNAADALRDDYLEVTIRPGAPSRLDFDSSRLPLTHDVNVTFPPFTAVARDVSGNAIQSFPTSAVSVSVSPPPFRLVGDVVPIIDGVASFTEFAIIGRRGVPYVLTLRLANASIDASRAVTLFPCAVVKPNAASTASGACACHPGFTEDVSRANGTGHVPLDVSFSSFPSLYADVDPTIIDAFVRSLRPYGACVPCAAGFYKPVPGASPCARCPPNTDTHTGPDRLPAEDRITPSGASLPGYLGNVNASACRCAVAVDGPSYYEVDAAAATCAPCPSGATCDSGNVTTISLDPGRWRANASSLHIVSCPSPVACVGGVGGGDAACARGHRGPACGSCAPGYAVIEESRRVDASLRCTKCWSAHVNRFVTVLILVAKMTVMGVVVFVSATSSPTGVVHAKTTTTHFQTLATLGTIDLGLPLGIGGLFESARVVASGEIRSFPVECAFDSSWTHVEYVGAVAVVGGLACACGVPYYAYERARVANAKRREWYEKKKRSEELYVAARRDGGNVDAARARLARAEKPPDFFAPPPDAYALMHLARVDGDGRVANAWTEEELARIPATPGDVATGVVYAVVYAMMWFPIAVGAARALRRSEIPGIGTFLVIDYDVQTNGDASRGFTTFLSATLVLAACACAGFPYAVYASLREHATRLRWAKTEARYGFFYLGFTDARYYWEFVILARKTILIVVAATLPDAPLLATYLSIGTLMGFLAATVLCECFEEPRHRRAEIASLSTTLVSYNLAAFVSTVRREWAQALGGMAVYAVNAYFVYVACASARGDVAEDAAARRREAERREIDDEREYRREGVKRALVDTHEMSRALHPRMAGELIASFDDQTLAEALSNGGAEDLKLKYAQLSIHLEGLRNTWRESKAGKTDAMKKGEHEIEALASERRRRAVDRERWRRTAAADDGDEVGSASSGGGEERSEKSDDSAYIEATNKSVEERVAQYNEIIAQQLHAHRLEKREEMFGSSSRSDDARAEPLYPPAYVPPPPRLPADDSVSHTPAAADIVLTSTSRQGKKPREEDAPSPSSTPARVDDDPFTYDYFEMTKVREALEADRREAIIDTLTREIKNPSAANPTTSSEPRRSWREKMADSRWRVRTRVAARETRAMMREFGTFDDDKDDKDDDDVRTTRENDVDTTDELDA